MKALRKDDVTILDPTTAVMSEPTPPDEEKVHYVTMSRRMLVISLSLSLVACRLGARS